MSIRMRATAALGALLLAACAVVATAPPAPEASSTPAEATPASEAPAAAPATPAPVPQGQAGPLRGRVSMYGEEFAGRKTASGEVFDPDALTMAHRTLPFGTRVRVTNLANHRSVEVVVNDRGPAVPGRIADLSLGAARQIGMVARGVVDALLEIVSPQK